MKKRTRFVEDDWKKLVWMFEKSQEDADFGHGIVGTTYDDEINPWCAYTHVV